MLFLGMAKMIIRLYEEAMRTKAKSELHAANDPEAIILPATAAKGAM